MDLRNCLVAESNSVSFLLPIFFLMFIFFASSENLDRCIVEIPSVSKCKSPLYNRTELLVVTVKGLTALRECALDRPHCDRPGNTPFHGNRLFR